MWENTDNRLKLHYTGYFSVKTHKQTKKTTTTKKKHKHQYFSGKTMCVCKPQKNAY